MSDAGNGEFANFDSRMLLYVPGWARRLAIGVLLLLVASSTALCAYAVFGKRELGIEVLLVGLSILQSRPPASLSSSCSSTRAGTLRWARSSPLQKLFWSQDVAMMTESFIRTALRNGLNLTTRCRPAPL